VGALETGREEGASYKLSGRRGEHLSIKGQARVSREAVDL